MSNEKRLDYKHPESHLKWTGVMSGKDFVVHIVLLTLYQSVHRNVGNTVLFVPVLWEFILFLTAWDRSSFKSAPPSLHLALPKNITICSH